VKTIQEFLTGNKKSCFACGQTSTVYLKKHTWGTSEHLVCLNLLGSIFMPLTGPWHMLQQSTIDNSLCTFWYAAFACNTLLCVLCEGVSKDSIPGAIDFDGVDDMIQVTDKQSERVCLCVCVRHCTLFYIVGAAIKPTSTPNQEPS